MALDVVRTIYQEKYPDVRLYLELKDRKYGNYMVTEVYYVKSASMFLGKVALNTVALVDKYNLTLTYSVHKITPKSKYYGRDYNKVIKIKKKEKISRAKMRDIKKHRYEKKKSEDIRNDS